ncbi:MAG TPA: hypothetical protein VEW71_04255 [Allosphingosinicella sp.]|nr:hypothetical protein [Allosphingosinicella sp.]
MILTAALALIGAAAVPAQPAPVRTGTAAMSVGATVVRPQPGPAIAILRGGVTLSNVDGVAVGVEGGIARRTGAGTVVITAAAAGPMIITLIY